MKPFCGSRYKPHKTNLVFFATILTKPLCSSCYNLHKTNLKFFATIITKPLCGSCYIATSVSVYSVGPGQPLQDTLKFRNIPNFLGWFLSTKLQWDFTNTSFFCDRIYSPHFKLQWNFTNTSHFLGCNFYYKSTQIFYEYLNFLGYIFCYNATTKCYEYLKLNLGAVFCYNPHENSLWSIFLP